MRIPPPQLLKLNAADLLEDVRERLAEALPGYADGPDDPTDPAWLVLEQVAWMVEILSEQLDSYPFSVVQHFVRMMGGELLPARPAVGVVVALPAGPGRMVQDPARPAPWRFFTPQTEAAEAVEFVPVEREVSLRPGSLLPLHLLQGGEIFRAGANKPGAGATALVAWRGPVRPSLVFQRERIRYVVTTGGAEALVEALKGAVATLEARKLGWLRLSVEQPRPDTVVIEARPDPNTAFADAVPTGVWGGGDLVIDWNTLDDCAWTPPIRIRDHHLVPLRLRGGRPMPGPREGSLLLPHMPENLPVEGLLVPKAAPMPGVAVEAIWRTLTNLDTKLTPLQPTIERSLLPPEDEGTRVDWVQPVLQAGLWDRLANGPERTLACVELPPGSREAGTLRLGLVLEQRPGVRAPAVLVYATPAKGRMPRTPLPHRVAWSLPLPPAGGREGLVDLVALDVPVEDDTARLILAADGPVQAVMLNPLMVVNAPAIQDGRSVEVNRNVPEGASMLFGDLVTPQVVRRLLEAPLPPQAARQLELLPLARFPVAHQAAIVDWAGLRVDATAGEATMNAPDEEGQQRTLRPGAQVQFEWYRRTDGTRAHVAAGAIRFAEQGGGAEPLLVEVHNPLPTFHGVDAETPEAAVDRLFAPTGGTPVLPGDFERLVRQALGARGRGWVVRCWSYPERALVSAALWKPEGAGLSPDPRVQALERELGAAGPECLLVVLGPPEGGLSDGDLAWARQVVEQHIRRLAERLPVVRRAVVTRYWPLTLRGECLGEAVPLPRFDLTGLRGVLEDEQGVREPVPRARLMLNAAVVAIEEPPQEGSQEGRVRS
ncbi:MAG: hypothetical protein ABIO70_20930 [Pseudomonadota bacterium]